ncbi:MAG: hypothetical protein KDA24_29120 [Deltaproteobacteria bacterium]|nr:hypothetical protein [Deltaproteobacteria bacterium]
MTAWPRTPRGAGSLLISAVLLAAGCSDLTFQRTPPPPPAEPPTAADDGTGNPPNWADCETAWLGQYFNLSVDDELVEMDPDEVLPAVEDLPLWDAGGLAFQQLDTALDFGSAWWPVDDGFSEDPRYFAVRWTAWIRALGDTTLELALGAKTDLWVFIGDAEVASIVGSEAFEPELVSIPLDGGQYSIEVRFAHRAGADNGMLFRVAGGDVVICEPEFE